MGGVKLCKAENYNALAVVLKEPDTLARLAPHGASTTFTYNVAPKELNLKL